MKSIGAALLTLSLASAGMASMTTASVAEDTTIVHKESADSDRSKTVVMHDNGSKTVIKRHGTHVKKIHTEANGDKTIIKKTAD